MRYVGVLNDKKYCRRCITFQGESANEIEFERKYKGVAKLGYKLSEEQEEISSRVLDAFKKGEDTLIYAVCGAGKTELVFKTINYALKKKLTIGFAIPRKDVVIELSRRLQSMFPKYYVIALYGGSTSLLVGDIICLTTHQLFRYDHYFDLLIVDEIDAFPFNGNYVLNAIFERSIRGHFIMMSATPTKEIMEKFKNKPKKNILTLYTRYHKKPIPVPKIIKTSEVLMPYKVLKILKEFLKINKPVLIFTPTIFDCEILFKMLNIFAKQGNFVHSKRKERSEIIDDFRENKYNFLVTTAVLERGITLKNLQVIVYDASNKLFSREGLIQISGRVGRVKDATEGEIFYIAKNTSQAMADSIEEIKRANTYL